MNFGQIVIGPPGSGKTTYCQGMAQFLRSQGRKVAIVNLDPGNEVLPYKPEIDVSDLITVEQAMEHLHLGPNGGTVHCMEYLEKNLDWLMDAFMQHSGCYFIVDCPGQVELYTHHPSIHNIFESFSKKKFNFTAVNLVDSYYCSEPGNFIAVLLTSLNIMLQVEMPHINVLSKCDLIEKFRKLAFNMDYYTEVLDLSQMIHLLSDDPILSKYKKMNEALVDVIESYSLVSFLPLSVDSKECMARIGKAADTANGYVFGINEEKRDIQSMLSCAMSTDFEDAKISEITEKYIDTGSSVSEPYTSYGR